MRIAVAEARAVLDELVDRAEAGEEVVLTREGGKSVRLVPIPSAAEVERRRIALERLSLEASGKASPGPGAAHAADFLYDENGLPA